MAKLSKRVLTEDELPKHNHSFYVSGEHLVNNTIMTTNKLQQENTMNTLREITLTLIDNNSNLEDNQRIVFQKKGVRTSYTDQQAKEDIIATGEVMAALKKHNDAVRSEVVREDILENTGREVMLKPIKLLSDPQLEWRIVATA